MILTRLEIDGFRSLSDVALEPHPTLNLLAGPNGSGKSSVLEAIHCLSTGHSFRTRKPRETVARDRDTTTIRARLRERDGDAEHRIGLARHRDGTLDLRVDFRSVESMADATRLLPVKVLSPDSHALVQEGPSERRRFLDWGVFHVEPRFLDAWRRFRRALAQRNQALRDHRPVIEVSSWNEQLAEAGTDVDGYRRAYVQALGAALSSRAARLDSPLDVALAYRAGWAEDVALVESLEANIDQHRQLRTTSDGPHRSELLITVDGVPARQQLSRGQQKVLVYLLHLAQLDLLESDAAGNAVVLCDDLLSELDADNSGNVVEQLLEGSGQLFVSGVSLAPLHRWEHFAFHVERGAVQARHVARPEASV